MKKIALLLMIVGVALWAATSAVDAASPHTARGCHSCHSIHHAKAPTERDYGVPLMAARAGSGPLEDGTFTLYQPVAYDSGYTTLQATLEQPNGPTKLCLSCHDGTYSHVGEAAKFTPTEGLAHAHPVSFVYDDALANADGELELPSAPSGLPGGGTIAERLLDSKGRMQCTSCHESHSQSIGDANLHWSLSSIYVDGEFVDSGERLMCTTCHIK